MSNTLLVWPVFRHSKSPPVAAHRGCHRGPSEKFVDGMVKAEACCKSMKHPELHALEELVYK